jgi:hypothetical protein
MNDPSVKIGDWYLDRDKHDFLCVIGVHNDEGVVDVRDEYGDIDEIEFDEWETMDLVLCSTPQEWQDRPAEDDFEDVDDSSWGAPLSAD